MPSYKLLSDSTNSSTHNLSKSLENADPSNGNFLKKIPIVRKAIKETSKLDESENLVNLDPDTQFYPPSQHLKSWIWKHLLISGTGRFVKCKICNLVYSRTCGSTTGLGRHLSRNHYDILKKNGTSLPVSHDSSISSNESFQNSTSTCNNSESKITPVKRKVSESNETFLPLPEDLYSTKRLKINEEDRPVEKSYKEVLTKLNQFYEDAEEDFLENDYQALKELSSQLTGEIKEKLANPEVTSICLSGEQWSNEKNEMFLGLNVHYLDENFNEHHYSFGLKDLEPSSQSINEILAKWNIKSKTKYFVSNTDKTLTGITSIPDTCHTINLCVKDVLTPDDPSDSDEIDFELISNTLILKLIKKCFKFAELVSKMIGQNLDLSSRWTSIYTVFDTLIENRDYLNQVFAEDNSDSIVKDYYPSDEEFQYISDFIHVFEPFRRMIIELSEKQYSACSLLYPGLFYYINHLKSLEPTTLEFEQIKSKLASTLRKRFAYLFNEHSDLFLSLSFLDYRFKYFKIFNNETLTNLTHDRVKSYLAKLFTNSHSDANLAEFECEFKEYLAFQPPSYYEKPLEFYMNHGHHFPILSRLARDLFSICSSAVPVERLFTNADHLVSHARSRIDKSKLEFVTFVKENYDLN